VHLDRDQGTGQIPSKMVHVGFGVFQLGLVGKAVQPQGELVDPRECPVVLPQQIQNTQAIAAWSEASYIEPEPEAAHCHQSVSVVHLLPDSSNHFSHVVVASKGAGVPVQPVNKLLRADQIPSKVEELVKDTLLS
jgi:hypothetical protein